MARFIPIPSPGVPLFYGEPGNPVVVVLHDEYGRLPGLVPYAEAIASRGFRVAVPDLFDGRCAQDPDTAQELMDGLSVATSLAAIDDVVDDTQATGVERVGLIGLSVGGWLALLHAQAGKADAVVSYYASLRAGDHGVIPCPVLLHLAETDSWPEGEDPAGFVSRLDDHGTPVAEHRYVGTGHLFANASLPGMVDARAAALAFARTAVFLETHLMD